MLVKGEKEVAAGHGAGCGLKPLLADDGFQNVELQPVMGPAVG